MISNAKQEKIKAYMSMLDTLKEEMEVKDDEREDQQDKRDKGI